MSKKVALCMMGFLVLFVLLAVPAYIWRFEWMILVLTGMAAIYQAVATVLMATLLLFIIPRGIYRAWRSRKAE